MARHMISISLAFTTLLTLTGWAQAHTGIASTSSFAHGFTHPLTGLDHVLAMLAVGLFAARLGGRALVLLPLAFMSMMALGGMLGVFAVDVPYVEFGIALSVIALGTAVALHKPLPLAAAMGLAGIFAIFHGHAHGAEMPATAFGLAYASGFLLATALLHGAGLAVGFATLRLALKADHVLRVAGGAVSLAGVALLSALI